MKSLDCRNIPCPQPVLRCRAAADAGERRLEVLVDNEPAVENVRRFLAGRGYAVACEQAGESCWRLTARAGTEGMSETAIGRCAVPDSAGEGKTLVLITTETIGRGDDSLGSRLMDNFLATLPELGPRLWRLILVNGGVRLATRPGPALEALQALAQNGVSVLVCGTCLAHYGLLAAKAVGETSNMLDIVTSLDLADKIIRP
ncbi:sulfurtransferase-like selenium metabolism protein YedF [Desulfovibrio sp. ZJ200]|uniref:sulfurtransferase-like selenium metabolism protein YedF n=1 Tax=Desulfovibrio sp. ZJ200 TaxID=2709792 RepID=UPI0013EA97E6|nr:sulfurtransferase-like selenium metabolism protein YedF [Desulfovibrio sp. ZJ200]